MESLGLLTGHLLGDYIAQTDWMASRKTTQTLPCLAHCAAYSLCVWACSFWWLPWWAVALCGVLHFPIDRWRLARRWMTFVGQEGFATGPLSPWSVVVVDNTFHVFTLLALGGVAQVCQ